MVRSMQRCSQWIAFALATAACGGNGSQNDRGEDTGGNGPAAGGTGATSPGGGTGATSPSGGTGATSPSGGTGATKPSGGPQAQASGAGGASEGGTGFTAGAAGSGGTAGSDGDGATAGATASAAAALPPWLSYCDANGCPGGGAVVVACAASDPACAPSRTTEIVPSVDQRPISAVFFPVTLPEGAALRLDSGNGSVLANLVWSYGSPGVLGSDLEVQLSYYDVAPVWGGTTSLDFESASLSSDLVDTVFYRHPSYSTGSAATDLHEAAQRAVAIERAIAGLTPEKVRALFMPSELAAASGGEGNFSYGDGTVTINYGNPDWVAGAGGILAAAMPRFDHEYVHELFDEVSAQYLVNSTCLNEGLADALPYVAGLTSESELGPVGVRGVDFDADCTGVSEIHDVGNCYFWHLHKLGLLDETLLRGVFHPQHTYQFDSCQQGDVVTGNSLLVLFTEASGGADVIPALDSMQVPHAASYDEAKQALGL